MEGNMIEFTVPGKPRGKGRPRAFLRGKGIAMHTDDKTAAYENLVALSCRSVMGDASPLDGPLRVIIEAWFTPPKSAPKRAREGMLGGLISPQSKPDIDNIAKAVLDGLNGVAYIDDTQVFCLKVFKGYASVARLTVCIEQSGGSADAALIAAHGMKGHVK